MASLPRPPRRCDPSTFFLQYLPNLWSTFSSGRNWQWPAGTAQIEVRVADEAPFTLTGAAGTLQATQGAASQPIVRISCDHEAWGVFIADVLARFLQHTENHLPMAHAGVRMISEQVTQENLDSVQQRAGSLILAYTDDAGDVSHYTIAVGNGVGPSATVQVKDSDVQMILDALAGDSMAENVARLLRTRIQITGDAAYVVRLLQ